MSFVTAAPESMTFTATGLSEYRFDDQRCAYGGGDPDRRGDSRRRR